MQLIYGVAGPPRATRGVFSRLGALALESNPDSQPRVEHGDRLSLGIDTRAFNTWSGDGLRLFLDGEIWTIDGQPTADKGRTPAELERVARLYRRHGAGLWNRLDGSFCLFIEDGDTLRVGVDINATRTLYYWLHDGVLAFATYVADLAPAYPEQLTEDWSSISVFLACGANVPQRTAWNEIQHLPAGCHLLFRDGSARCEEYFHLVFDPEPRRRQTDELMDELGEALCRSIETAWHAAERPVLPLSGGSDSRYIIAEVARMVPDPAAVQTITWGTHRERPGSDAEVAAQVAKVLGINNVWHEKAQHQNQHDFERALYLSSGEADVAVHYPNDASLNDELADVWGFGSILRGDTAFSRFPALLTSGAIVPESMMRRLLPDNSLGAVLPEQLFRSLVAANRETMDHMVGSLRSPKPTGKRQELYRWYRHRQILGTYSKVKQARLDAYSPLLGRSVLEWLSRCPEWAARKPALFDILQASRFPELAEIPFAKRSNLPAWRARFGSEPELARFYGTLSSTPGWLADIGAQEAVVAGWQSLEAAAAVAAPPSTGPRKASWKDRFKHTLPGRLLRELTVERRDSALLPPYLTLARLTVLHNLLGRVAARKAGAPAFAALELAHVP